MARSKQKNAEELIDNFARDLLALNDGKAISRQLKNHLLKAIKPSPAKRGVKLSYGRVAEIAKQLTLSREEIDRLRTKHHNPASYKDEIASAAGVSRKTVERINVGIENILARWDLAIQTCGKQSLME